MEQEIIGRRLSPGSFMGSERQLAARFGVGRATLRSAVRQLEMLELAAVRAGRGGGLYVTGDPGDAAANRLSAWLVTLRLRFTDVVWASWVLLQFASGRAARRLNEASAARLGAARTDTYACANELSAYIGRRTRLRLAIVEAADNPALLILFKALDRTWRQTLLPYYGTLQSEEEGVAATRRGDQDLVEAILSGQEVSARATARVIAKNECERIGGRVSRGNLPDEAVPKTAFVATRFGGQTLSAMAVRALHEDIRRLAAGANPHLGTLAELSVRYGVGLDVMREAAAQAERNGLVTVQRGRKGGVSVRDTTATPPREQLVLLSPELLEALTLDDRHFIEIAELLTYGRSILREEAGVASKTAMLECLETIVGQLTGARQASSSVARAADTSLPRSLDET